MPEATTPEIRRSKTAGRAAQATTTRQRAADVLLDKQRLLVEAERIAKVGSWRQHRDGRIAWSDEMYRILGIAPEKFTPSPESVSALIHSGDRTAMQSRVAAACSGQAVDEVEFRVMRPDGSERHVIARAEAARSATGQVDYVTGTVQDITDRQRAEAAVRDAATRYRQLFEANPHPMWIYDPTTLRFLAVNDAAVGQYGYPRDEFLGMTLNDLHPPEAVPSLVEVVARLDAQNPAPLWRHQLRDGRLIDMEIIAQTINFEGRPARVVLAHDVTERRRAAQDVLDSREALRALIQRLQSAQEEERARVSREIHDELGQ